MLVTEGHSATLEHVLPTMEYVLKQYKEGKGKYATNPFISAMVNEFRLVEAESVLHLDRQFSQ